MVKDMTNGKPIKLILGFCIPMLFGNLFQQLYNMADSIIVGKFIGVNALAGVGSTGSLTFLVIGFVIGLCSGFSINIAQSFGAGNYKEMRKYAANSLYLCGAFSVVLTVTTVLLTRPLLVVMQTPEEIMNDAYNYIIVIFAGISVIMFYNILSCILRAVGDSKTPLIFLIIASVLNVILDLIFILVFKMGVFGAGLATVLAQTISVILCIIHIKRKYFILHFEKDELKLNLKMCGKLISLGMPMALQFSITAIGAIILQWAVNSLGSDIVASVTAASKIQLIAIQPMETLGLTMATFGGQNLGAKKYDRIHSGVRQSLVMGLIYSVVICIVMSFFGRYISLLFIDKDQTEIIAHIERYLRLNGIFYPFLSVLFILRNTLQGLGYSLLPMMAGVSELVARALVSFVFVSSYGYDAVCYAAPIAWVFADILLIATYIAKQNALRRICNYCNKAEKCESV